MKRDWQISDKICHSLLNENVDLRVMVLKNSFHSPLLLLLFYKERKKEKQTNIVSLSN